MNSEQAESIIRVGVSWLRLAGETVGALIIALGIVVSVSLFLRSLRPGGATEFKLIRLTLARCLALALEFQLGADLLSTAIAPSWDAIGRLAAIAVIRTGLNFFLMREMQEERAGTGPDAAARQLSPP